MYVSCGFLKNQTKNNGKITAYTLSKNATVSDEMELNVLNKYKIGSLGKTTAR